MDRKKLMALVIGILVLMAVIIAVAQPKQDTTPESAETVTETTQAAAEANNESNDGSEEISQKETAADAEKKESGNTGSEAGPSENKTTNASAEDPDESEPLIPEENVQMGVVPGEDDGGLDGPDIVDAPIQNVPSTEKKPGNSAPDETLGSDFDITQLTYESYNAMNGTQQRQVIEMFANVEEFMKWYRAVEAQYKAEHPDIEIGADGVINAEDLIKK